MIEIKHQIGLYLVITLSVSVGLNLKNELMLFRLKPLKARIKQCLFGTNLSMFVRIHVSVKSISSQNMSHLKQFND